MFERFKRRTRRYRRVLAWVVTDSLVRYRRVVARLFTVNGVALALQAGALALLLGYARALERGEPISPLGVQIDTRASYPVLVAVVVLAGTAFVAAGSLRRYSDHGYFKLGKQYGLFCATRLIAQASRALHAPGAGGPPVEAKELDKLSYGGVVMCARATHRIANMLPTIAGFVIFAGFLVYLDALLALLLAAVLGAFSFFFYKLSLTATAVMRRREEDKQGLSQARRRLLDALRYATAPLDPETGLIKRGIQEGVFERSLAGTLRTQSLQVDSTYINQIAQALAIVVITLVKGREIIATGTGFGELVVFLAAGRMAMTHFAGVTNAFIMTNRFYPSLADYFAVVGQLELSTSSAASPPEEVPRSTTCVQLTLPYDPSSTPRHSPEIRCGDKVAVLAPKSLDRFSVLRLLPGLRSASRPSQDPDVEADRPVVPAECWLVPPQPILIDSFAGSVGLPASTGVDDLHSALSGMGVGEQARETLPADLHEDLDEAAWGAIAPEALAAASLYAAVQTRRPMVFVNNETLRAVDPEAPGKLVENLATDHILMIAYKIGHASKVGGWGEDYALLDDGTSFLGYVTVEQLRTDPRIVEELEAGPTEALDHDFLDDE